jgi:hypothetical protein
VTHQQKNPRIEPEVNEEILFWVGDITQLSRVAHSLTKKGRPRDHSRVEHELHKHGRQELPLRRQEVEETMNTLFAGNVYIRLADDNSGFVCTIRYGKFYSKATEFALHQSPPPVVSDEMAPALARKRSSRRAASGQQ